MSRQKQTSAKTESKPVTTSTQSRLLQSRWSDRDSSQQSELAEAPPILHEALGLPIHVASRFRIQPKLTIGPVDDQYEQEADRVATQVVNQINAPHSSQRDEAIQRQGNDEDDKLRMKPALQNPSSGIPANPELESEIGRSRSGGKPLAENICTSMERAFGADFSSVKVHTDSRSNQLNQSIQAKAFTNRQDIFFRQGAYQPGSKGGQELIAHELTHVVQQNSSVRRSPSNLILTAPISSDQPTKIARQSHLETTVGTTLFRSLREQLGDNFSRLKYLSISAINFLGTFQHQPNFDTFLANLAPIGTQQQLDPLIIGAAQAQASFVEMTNLIIPNGAFLLQYLSHVPEAIWALRQPGGNHTAIVNYLIPYAANPQELQLAKDVLTQNNQNCAIANQIVQYLLPHLAKGQQNLQLAKTILAQFNSDPVVADQVMVYLDPYIAGGDPGLKLAQGILASSGNNIAAATKEMAFLKDYLTLGDDVIKLAQGEFTKAAQDATVAQKAMDQLAKYNYDPALQQAVEQFAQQRAQQTLTAKTQVATDKKNAAIAAAHKLVEQAEAVPVVTSGSGTDKRKANKERTSNIEKAKQAEQQAQQQAEEQERQDIEQANQETVIAKQQNIAEVETFLASNTKLIGAEAADRIIQAVEGDIAGLTPEGVQWLVQQTQTNLSILTTVLPFLKTHLNQKAKAMQVLRKTNPPTVELKDLINLVTTHPSHSFAQILWALDQVADDPARAAIALKLSTSIPTSKKLSTLLTSFTTDLNRLDQLVTTHLNGLSEANIVTALDKLRAELDEAATEALVVRLLEAGGGLTATHIHDLVKLMTEAQVRFLDNASGGTYAGIAFPMAAKNLLTGTWNAAEMNVVLETARTKGIGVVPYDDLCHLLQLAKTRKYANLAINSCLQSHNLAAAHWTEFFTHEANFNTAKNNGMKNLSPDGTGGKEITIETFNRPAAGPLTHRVKMTSTQERVNHYCNGHTFEYFLFSYDNCTRAANSSLWAVGQDRDMVKGYATGLAGKADVRNTADTQVQGGFYPTTANGYSVGFTRAAETAPPNPTYTARLDQFYPEPPAQAVREWVLCAIGSLLRSTPFHP